MRLSIFTASIITIAASAGLTTINPHLQGTVEQSFDENFRLVRAKGFIYQIDTTVLSNEQKRSLDRVGDTITMNFTPGAIVRAWPVNPETVRVRKSAASVSPDAIVAEGIDLHLTGTIIPTSSAEYDYIQIGPEILQIKANDLAQPERKKFETSNSHVTVLVPKTAVRFAWSTPSEIQQRAPAQINPDPERFWVHRKRIEISGTVLYSFDEACFLLQSGNTFFQLDKAIVERNLKAKRALPGDHINISVPVRAISLVWAQN